MGIDERALRVVWTVFLFALLIALVYYIRSTIALFAIAIFFSYMLSPLVGLIERFIPRRKTLALGLVYAALIGILVLLGFELIPAATTEAKNLAAEVPNMLKGGPIARIWLPHWLEPVRAQVISTLTQGATGLSTRVLPFLQRSGARIVSGLSYVLLVVLVPILAFFFLKDGHSIRIALLGAVEEGHDRTTLELIIEDVHLVLGRYIRALILLALASFAAWLIFLSAMRYSYELLLAGICGVLEFIPVIGPAAALVVLLVVCAITGSGGLLWIIVFWGCFRIFQDYVLNPYVMSAGIEIHPLLVLFGVLAGAGIGGVTGMFFSVPAIAVLRVVYLDLRAAYTRKQLVPTTSNLAEVIRAKVEPDRSETPTLHH